MSKENVNLDALDAAYADIPEDLEHLQSEVIDVVAAYRPMAAELRTLRARVEELEDKAAGYLHAFKDGCERSTEAVAALEARAESAEARVRELEAAADRNANVIYADESVERYRKRIADLESQLAAALEAKG